MSRLYRKAGYIFYAAGMDPLQPVPQVCLPEAFTLA
jgi:hypothetical protein